MRAARVRSPGGLWGPSLSISGPTAAGPARAIVCSQFSTSAGKP